MMGTHFSAIGDAEEKKKKEDEKKAEAERKRKEAELDKDSVRFGDRRVKEQQLQQWMADPQIRAALNDPFTAQVIQECSADPNALSKYRKLPQIQLLLRAGIIQAPHDASSLNF
mmetsp:Transcript_30498/g.42491  ORF Transcript_30498/g.42491 Transcript_30498/m.42491 type:complete len:114 (+) Transcript_30498:41-382(+)